MSRFPHTIADYFRQQPTIRELLSESMRQQRLKADIQALLPEPLKAHCTAALQKESQLIIYTDSSAWASRFRYFSRELRQKLLDSGLKIDKVTIRVTIESRPAKRKRERIRRLSPENASLISQVADGIEDPSLKAALRRLVHHQEK
jgi:hypothetical protein